MLLQSLGHARGVANFVMDAMRISRKVFKRNQGSIIYIHIRTGLKILSKTSRLRDKMHADTVAFSSTKC